MDLSYYNKNTNNYSLYKDVYKDSKYVYLYQSNSLISINNKTKTIPYIIKTFRLITYPQSNSSKTDNVNTLVIDTNTTSNQQSNPKPKTTTTTPQSSSYSKDLQDAKSLFDSLFK